MGSDNGRAGFLHAYVDVPAPTAVIVRATVTRIHEGRFGLCLKAGNLLFSDQTRLGFSHVFTCTPQA